MIKFMYVWRKSFLAAVGLIILAILYTAFAMLRPLPVMQPKVVEFKSTAKVTTNLTWPETGQAAVGAEGFGVLETHGTQTAVPTASVTKVLTALAVLQKKPLKLHEQGPNLILSDKDVALYSSYAAKDGSVVRVAAGEQISEYQALQAMLLPSANNMADSLVVWAFGSLENYTAFANQYVKQLGLDGTHIADASGFSSDTVSTAGELVEIGLVAMQNSVIAEIVSQTEADVPVAGTIKNVNILLGQNGIVGIKTGNTEQAGGVFLSAKRVVVDGQQLTLISAVMGTTTLWRAMQSSLPLLASAQTNFSLQNPVKSGQIIATYQSSWGQKVTASAQKDLKLLTWRGKDLNIKANISAISGNSRTNQLVGTVTAENIGTKRVLVSLDNAVHEPSWSWRLTHPLH